jgi:hypothetical protein
MAATAMIRLELGPQTLETLEAMVPTNGSTKKQGVEALLRKGADAVRK